MSTLAAGSGRRVGTRWGGPLLLLALLLGAAGAVALAGLSPAALLVALATWLHTLATIVWIGYYLFTGLIYLPVLERQMPAAALRGLLEQISARQADIGNQPLLASPPT